jgi:hypothetical protein
LGGILGLAEVFNFFSKFSFFFPEDYKIFRFEEKVSHLPLPHNYGTGYDLGRRIRRRTQKTNVLLGCVQGVRNYLTLPPFAI